MIEEIWRHGKGKQRQTTRKKDNCVQKSNRRGNLGAECKRKQKIPQINVLIAF